MKNIKAILIAFLMFAVTVTAVKFVATKEMPKYSVKYGTWIDPSKFSSNKGLKNLLKDKNSIAVFGSSELKHCQNSGFHGNTIFQNTDMKPVFIGKGGYQSLYHAIAVGSIGETLKGRKIVISVSPQWFKNTGVKEDAFGATYSESNFIEFLKNKDISDSTKDYVISRAIDLTKNNPAMCNRIKDDVRWYRDNSKNPWDIFRKSIHTRLVEDKADIKLFLNAWKAGMLGKSSDEKADGTTNKKLKWKKYYKKAEKKGIKKTSKNQMGMLDNVYNKKYKKLVDQNIRWKPTYTENSVEGKDLACLLQICKEENLQVMVVLQPFNGLYNDYIRWPKKRRNAIYNKIRKIAKEYDVQLADMTDGEYEKYYFEDESHLALKGLVTFNEKIYDFYKQPSK